jgi:Dual specificity phosphatase, catalytic domain
MSKVYIPPYIHRLMDYIYISDYRASIDYDKFDLVVDMNYPQNGAKESQIEESYVGATHLIKVGIKEHTKEDLTNYFKILFPYIQKNADLKKKTLILSHTGEDRSAMLFSAYLIKKYKFSLQEISHMFQTHGFIPRIDPSFINQLDAYYQACSGQSSPIPTLTSSQKIDEKISKSYLSNEP